MNQNLTTPEIQYVENEIDTANPSPANECSVAIEEEEWVTVGADPVEALTKEERKSYKQSLYIATIEKYFGLSGLVCYTASECGNGFNFGFKHVATGERVLVFSCLNHSVFEIDSAMEQKHRIIIDCKSISVPFEECDYCHSDQYLASEEMNDARNNNYHLLINGVLYGDGNYEGGCGGCWGRLQHHVIAKSYAALRLVEAQLSSLSKAYS